MFHTKYQGSRPCGFRQEDFNGFPLYAYVKHVTPEAGPIWSQGHNLNKHGRSLLGGAIISNIKALCLVVSGKKIFSCFPIQANVKHVTPWMGPFLASGALFEHTWYKSTR